MAPAKKTATRRPVKPPKRGSVGKLGVDPFVPPPPVSGTIAQRPPPAPKPAVAAKPPPAPEPSPSGPPPLPEDPPSPAVPTAAAPEQAAPSRPKADPKPPPVDDGMGQYDTQPKETQRPEPKPEEQDDAEAGAAAASEADGDAEPTSEGEAAERSPKEQGDDVRGLVSLVERFDLGLNEMIFRDVMPDEKRARWLEQRKLDKDEKAFLVKALRPFVAKHPELFDSNNMLYGALAATYGLRIVDTAMLVKKLHFPEQPEEPEHHPKPRPAPSPKTNGPMGTARNATVETTAKPSAATAPSPGTGNAPVTPIHGAGAKS